MFDALAAQLEPSYRVVRYDHRGQGASAPAPRDELDMDTLTDDAAALIEALDLAPCVFVGNSMGGFVALRLAAHHPELLRGIVVAGSAGDAEQRVAEFDPLVAAMADGGVAPVLDIVTHIMVGDTTLTDPARASLLASVREQLSSLGPEIADPAWQVVHREGVLDALAHCPVAVLVLAGAEDHAYTVEQSRAVAEAVPNGRLEVVDQVGHSVALEAPAEVAGLIDAFVRETSNAHAS
jgi:3-oxoadipate enol-lactonase